MARTGGSLVPPRLTVAGRTHRGGRLSNEDAFRLIRPVEGQPPLAGALVLDGMGGHAGGRLAARLGARAALDALLERPAADPQQRLRAAVAAAQAAILAHRRADPALREMASTFVGALTDGRHLWVATLGDSPVYQVRAGQAVRLVGPHVRSTAVGTVVTRYLGDGTGPEELEAEIGGQDRIVLCSDGLSDVVPPLRIAELVAGRDAEPATCALLSEALRRQTSDNVTAATIAVDAGDAGRLTSMARALLARSLWMR